MFKTQVKQTKEAEIIGCCFADDQTTKLVAGQHYYPSHAPRAEGGK